MSLRTYVAKKVGIHVCSSPFSSPDNFIFLATLAALGRTAAGADGVFLFTRIPCSSQSKIDDQLLFAPSCPPTSIHIQVKTAGDPS